MRLTPQILLAAGVVMKCDVELLHALVEQSTDPAVGLDQVADHVERCRACQNTLLTLGGAPAEWDDAQQWLLEITNNPDDGDDPPPTMPVDLTFLEESSHPEMLGRIGRYDIEAVLGRGGMGVVFRAHDGDLHRTVAVKVMAPEWAASSPARRRFAREAQAAASVAHENVIPIYNVEANASLPYLVMQYVPGMTLQRWVATNGPLDLSTMLRVAGQLAEGLAAAHRRGLIHRDIKPANVMVGENIDRVWITDFGLARAADSMTLTQTGVIAGTPHYMSPEQARGQPVDQRSDLFSLGCVFYFLATGNPPFEADNTLAVLHRIVSDDAVHLTFERNDLPPAFALLVHSLLQRSPAKRPKNCADVVGSLSLAQEQLGQGRTAKPPVGRKTLGAVYAVAICSALMVVGAYIYFGRLNQQSRSPNLSLNARVPAMANPWTESDLPISAATVETALRIEESLVRDTRLFAQQISQLESRMDRIQFESLYEVVFDPMASTGQWEQEIQRIEASILQANQFEQSN